MFLLNIHLVHMYPSTIVKPHPPHVLQNLLYIITKYTSELGLTCGQINYRFEIELNIIIGQKMVFQCFKH